MTEKTGRDAKGDWAGLMGGWWVRRWCCSRRDTRGKRGYDEVGGGMTDLWRGCGGGGRAGTAGDGGASVTEVVEVGRGWGG